MMLRRCLVLGVLACFPMWAVAAEAADERLQLRLPPSLEVRQLAEVLVEHAGVDLQFDPARITGTVRLNLPPDVTAAGLWSAANQSLLSVNVVTVASGDPPQYRMLPIAEAAAAAEIMLPGRLAGMVRKPGFATVVIDLKHLASETAVKSLVTVLSNQVSQVRTLGQESHRLVLSAPVPLIAQAESILSVIDRPGIAPAVLLFRPRRTAPQALQAAANAAWTASGRVSGLTAPAEFQIAPDGQQLLIVATAEIADEVVALAERLDQAEPVEVRSYRPAHFGLEEVAGLLGQVLKDSHQPGAEPQIVRDRLTNRLVVTATAAQHTRIEALLKDLAQTPAASRRQLRSIPVRHRPVEEMAKLLGLVLAQTSGGGGSTATTVVAQATNAAATSSTTTSSQAGAQLPQTGGGASSVSSRDADISIATDPPTNRLILLGEPQQLEQVARVVEQLDVHQLQVQLEVVLATLSSSQNRSLGLELVGQFSRGETSAVVGSLFGLSGGTGVSRTLPAAASGLGALVIKPGDYAGVLRAIETVTGGNSAIRTSVVVTNNAKATINGVVQQPLTSINSSNTVSTTSVSGTTDAGTQITISPQITAADQVTLTYTIEQSSFIGSSTTTSEGTVIPAPKRSDSLASVATIPDGHIIALGGLTSSTSTNSKSQIPWIGSVPVLGWPFQSRTTEETDSRFYVFIRADVLRSANFADLRRLGMMRAGDAGVSRGWPTVAPQFTP